jgi:hypothetical protein
VAAGLRRTEVGDGLSAKLGLGGVGAWAEADLGLGTYLGLLEFWGGGVLGGLDTAADSGVTPADSGVIATFVSTRNSTGGGGGVYTPRPTVPNHLG